jgi:aminoglycoside phosphotransferase (APT) family kinase protein
MNDAEALRDALARRLDGERDRWRLGDGPIRLEPVLNWGGFMNASFRVATPARTLHLKLAVAEGQTELRRWLAVHEHLSRHYCAPRVLGWIDVPDAGRGGLVFEHIDGRPWDFAAEPQRVAEIVEVLDRLHRDDALAARLGDGARTLRQCWAMRYREQFEEDLKIVGARRPPFVSEASLAWMEAESQRLLALGRDHPVLDGVTRAPCHWDGWSGNVMVGNDGSLWILDWDGLSAGDPALDFTTVLWAHVLELKQDWRPLLRGTRALDASFDQRVDLHLRAVTLDWTIDVLADWIQAEATPWGEQVRRRNQSLHLRHLAWYRERWG